MGFWKYVLGTPRNYALTFKKVEYKKISDQKQNNSKYLFMESMKLFL